MRGIVFRRSGLYLMLTVMVIGLAAVAAEAQMQLESEAALAEMSTATVTLTDSGIVIEPDRPGPGPVRFTVINNTSTARGLVINGEDRANTPILRYSNLISPGSSGTVDFWMFLGKTYTFRDFTSRSVVGDETRFTSRFSTSITYPAPAGFGRGPSFERSQVDVSLTDTGINMGTIEGGPTTFSITNNSSSSRGFVISGVDRAGTPIIRYTRILRPGESTTVNFWLFGDQSYTVRDYTSRRLVGGEMRFTSANSLTFTAPLPQLEGGLGPGTTIIQPAQ